MKVLYCIEVPGVLSHISPNSTRSSKSGREKVKARLQARGAPDPRWNDDELSTLKVIKGSNFEVVQMGTVITH